MPSMENKIQDDREMAPEDDLSRYDPLNMHIGAIEDDNEPESEQPEVPETSESEDYEEPEFVESSIVWKIEDFPDDKIFDTNQVADLVNLKRGYEVRNLMKYWNDYLKVKKDDKGHFLWTKDDVVQLQDMLEIKKKRNLTVEETLKYYVEEVCINEDDETLPAAPLSRANIKEYFMSISQSFENALESKTTALQSSLESKTDALKDDNAKILEQIETNKKETDETLKKMFTMMENMQADQKRKDDEIKRLQEENAALKAAAEEPKKKKTFFGIPIG